jgi:hypothetical protein
VYHRPVTPPLPAPPYPDVNSPYFLAVTRAALRAFERGLLPAEEAILYAAVHAWAEGHIAGEQCAGCNFRRTLAKAEVEAENAKGA